MDINDIKTENNKNALPLDWITGGKTERNVPTFTSSFMTDDVSFPKYGVWQDTNRMKCFHWVII